MIRHGNYGDISQLRDIWIEVFGEEEYADGFFRHVFRPEHTLCQEEGGAAAAVLYKIPCSIHRGQGEYQKADYLYALATRPEARGRGLMGRLIERAQEESRGQGKKVVFLIPAEESLKGYYKRFGFLPLENIPVFEMRCPRAGGEITLKSVAAEQAAPCLQPEKWKITNRNVYFPAHMEAFCLEWALKEEGAVFYKLFCQDSETGFLFGKREGSVLLVSLYGMEQPCWLQIGEALAESGITALRIPSRENPCGLLFRELKELGGYPVLAFGSEHIDMLHGLMPV